MSKTDLFYHFQSVVTFWLYLRTLRVILHDHKLWIMNIYVLFEYSGWCLDGPPWLVFKTCYRAMEIIHIKFFEMSVNIICQFQNWTNSKHCTVGNQDLLYQFIWPISLLCLMQYKWWTHSFYLFQEIEKAWLSSVFFNQDVK